MYGGCRRGCGCGSMGVGMAGVIEPKPVRAELEDTRADLEGVQMHDMRTWGDVKVISGSDR